jgi:FeS assembly SUF system protein
MEKGKSTASDGRAPARDGGPGLRERIIEMLKTCYDPEIPVDIYELGLIYDIDIDDGGNVAVKMTLTSPMCPVAGSLPPEVEQKLAGVHGVRDVRVDLVWDPPWDKERMSDEAKLRLNLM